MCKNENVGEIRSMGEKVTNSTGRTVDQSAGKGIGTSTVAGGESNSDAVVATGFVVRGAVGAKASKFALYPQHSRTELARACGMAVSDVSSVLMGRKGLGLEKALALAAGIGISVEELSKNLAGQRAWFREREKAR